MEYISNEKNKAPYFWLWLIFFLYTALVAVLVQMVLLPYVFPAWHGGNGLLVGGDWLSFHHFAVDLAEKIKTTGWGAWELRPQGQTPAGIAAIIYALTVPQPWTMIPLNAVLHASAALVLLHIVEVFITNRKYALLCVLPFLLFPSAMTWYTQLHKDGFFILGCLCFLYGLILLAKDLEREFEVWEAIKSIAIIIAGIILVWIVRPYGVQMLLGVTVGIVTLIGVIMIGKLRRGQINISNVLKILASYLIVILILIPFKGWGGIVVETPILQEYGTQEYSTEQNHNVSQMATAPKNSEFQAKPQDSWLANLGAAAVRLAYYPWQYMNGIAYSLGSVRDGFRFGYPGAGSNIDCNVGLYGVKDIICYLPRAIEISFLAPFPNQWFAQGTLVANTAMRRVSALEMFLIYIFLAFLPYSLWHWRKRIEVWIVMIFCTAMMLGFALVISNIGSLYRTRYGFIMTLVSVGIAGGILLMEQVKTKRAMKRVNQDLGSRSVPE